MITRAQIIAEALKWQGATWHHRALVPYRFCDCVRLMESVAKQLDLLDPAWQPPVYSIQWQNHQNAELLQQVMCDVGAEAIPLDARQPADLLGFQFGRTVSHMAILIAPEQVLHAVYNERRVVVNGLRGAWLTRLRCAWRFPGVEA